MNNKLKVLLWCIGCFLLISIYGKYRCDNPNYHDPLMNKLGFVDLDGWSITHFLFFALLGYLYPDTIWFAMILGLSWELFEHLLGKNRPAILGGFGDCISTDPGIEGSWWFGRISDIIVNMLGFIVGIYIKSKIN